MAPSSHCCLGNSDIVFFPFTHAVHVINVIDWQRVRECNSPLWQVKDMQHKFLIFFFFIPVYSVKFPSEFLEDWNLAIFNAFPNICFLDWNQPTCRIFFSLQASTSAWLPSCFCISSLCFVPAYFTGLFLSKKQTLLVVFICLERQTLNLWIVKAKVLIQGKAVLDCKMLVAEIVSYWATILFPFKTMEK